MAKHIDSGDESEYAPMDEVGYTYEPSINDWYGDDSDETYMKKEAFLRAGDKE